MPIIDIELVTGPDQSGLPGKEQLQVLADELGKLFDSEAANTWVKLRSLDVAQYAENQSAGEPGLRPTFVNVLHGELPDEDQLRVETANVAAIVARTLNRPRENVHVLYAPAAKGRIGFGGQLPE